MKGQAMAMKLLSPPSSLSSPKFAKSLFFFTSSPKGSKPISSLVQLFQWRSKNLVFNRKMEVKACVKVEQKNETEVTGNEWGKVSAVLFDMDGVLCNSEEPSRMAGVDVFAEMGVEVTVDDFVPFMGTGNIYRS